MEVNKESSDDKSLRNGLIIFGYVLVIVARFIPNWFYLVPAVIGIILVIIGCYFWTKYKNISAWHTLWGIIAPVGFIPLALIKSK
jgi:uncharacterized membrane protein